MSTLRILTAEGCKPCEELKEMLDAGRLIVEADLHGKEVNVEVVDVTSDEGFRFVERYNPEGVPSAYLGDKQCKISYENDDGGKRRAVISCRDEDELDGELPEPPAPA